LLLYALRAAKFEARQRTPVKALSREGLLLLNNIFLVVAAVAVLLGTLYPIIGDALGIGRISVGPQYFNSVFIPLTAPLVVLIGFAAVMAWKKTRPAVLRERLWLPLIVAIVLAVALALVSVGIPGLMAIAGCVLGAWAICASLADVVRRMRGRRIKLPRAALGMALAHTGVGVFVIGVTLVSVVASENIVRLQPGDSATVPGSAFACHGISDRQGPNYHAEVGHFAVTRDGHQVAELYPAKRHYVSGGQVMTEAGIHGGIFRDLYASLGRPLEGDAWSVRVYYKPFVRWIWGGGFLVALGGFLALSDKRYWRRRRAARQAREHTAAAVQQAQA